ncbi:MAG TPA: DUF3794 domain-containing protein [Selenomonadales bacterium]|nr:DUF3794 domain-containing protein [Selenomonadales bacterium]
MDDKKTRQTVSASLVGTSMNSWNQCTLGAQTGPIIVRQVIGEQEQQKVLDINIRVPDEKPPIEQIIDVFVKDVDINSVDVITDKIIVRGDLEIKAIYVADTPDQAVHAVELRHVKWTQDIAIAGARKGMDAEASVVVEFVDYDVNEHTHAHRHKYGDMKWHDDDCDDDYDHDCDDDCDDDDDCDHHHHHHHHHICREFDVSVVLKITAKVLADREVQIGAMPTMPTTPKG